MTLLLLLPVLACKNNGDETDTELINKARKVHNAIITLDTHIDINVKNFTDSLNYTMELPTQVNLPKMDDGGLDVAWLIVYTAQDSLTEAGYQKASENASAKFNAIHRLCTEYAPDQIGLARNSADIRRLYAAGKKIAMIGVENAYPAGTDLGNFQKFHEQGARYVSLAHNGHSQFCDSHTGEESGTWLHGGLSELGRQAVAELNRLGIMIDVSHVSRESMMQICALSRAPVIASHSSARALCDQSRNLDDEQLDRIRDLGGVVQTVALDDFLNATKNAKFQDYMQGIYKEVADSLGIRWHPRSDWEQLDEAVRDLLAENYSKITSLAREKAAKDPKAPPAVDVVDFVDHIDYMVNRIGIDHVGISSDFDGGGGIKGWSDASETFNVTLELVKRGYSREAISKLWGGNLMRVLDEVQSLASEEQPS